MSKFIIINILNSLNNHVKSFSLRKEIAALYALFGIILDIVFFFKVKDPYYLLFGLVVNFCFILLILGIITLEQLIKFKNILLKEEKSVINSDVKNDVTKITEENIEQPKDEIQDSAVENLDVDKYKE